MIICIYGDYGVGKDVFADMLVESYQDYINEFCPDFGISVKKIKSYTTRKKRYEDENTHTFITKNEWENLTNFIAKTKINNEFYGATLEQFDSTYNIYVVNEEGLVQVLASKYHKEKSKKMGRLCIIKINRPLEKRNVNQERLNREKVFGLIDKEFLEENTHIEIDNTGSLQDLADIAASLPFVLPYFKLIE